MTRKTHFFATIMSILLSTFFLKGCSTDDTERGSLHSIKFQTSLMYYDDELGWTGQPRNITTLHIETGRLTNIIEGVDETEVALSETDVEEILEASEELDRFRNIHGSCYADFGNATYIEIYEDGSEVIHYHEASSFVCHKTELMLIEDESYFEFREFIFSKIQE